MHAAAIQSIRSHSAGQLLGPPSPGIVTRGVFATAVHVDAVGSALVAPIVGNHAGGAISPTDLAAKLYGNCGYCGARLEDRWRPVVDGYATCDGCYVSQSTIGAQTVELRFDMNVEVISYAAPAGYEATLEAQVAADVREWEKMRRALAPQNLKVMGVVATPE